MSNEKKILADAIIQSLQRETPLHDERQGDKPRRYARSTRSIKVGTHLWPDVLELVKLHAEEHRLTPSGAVHDCLRRYFKLPKID